MVGKGAVVTVETVTSNLGKVYNKIARISPPKTSLTDYAAQVIPLEQFSQSAAPVAPAPVAPAPAQIAQPAQPVAPAPVAQPVASTPPAIELNPDDNCPF